MDYNKIIEELEKKKRHNRIIGKKISLIFVASAVILGVLFGAFAVWQSGWFFSQELSKPGGYIFDHNNDYGYDIMQDEAYLDILDSESLIYLSNAQTGVTESLEPEEYEEKGTGIKLMTKLIKAIQMGDEDSYNSCFGNSYLIAEGKRKAEASASPEQFRNYTDEQYAEYGKEAQFTMQQIYSVYITLISETANESVGTKTYVYELKYKIRRNNGTLRYDMESDAYRPQEITVLEDLESGAAEIISVTTFYPDSSVTVVHGWRIALIVTASVLIVAGDIVLFAVLMKKIKKAEKAYKNETEDQNGDSEEKNEETVSD